MCSLIPPTSCTIWSPLGHKFLKNLISIISLDLHKKRKEGGISHRIKLD